FHFCVVVARGHLHYRSTRKDSHLRNQESPGRARNLSRKRRSHISRRDTGPYTSLCVVQRCRRSKRRLQKSSGGARRIRPPLQISMNEPLVSVVLPVYNCAQYASEAVQSILAQSFSNFEFIIIDDGSTDHTADVLRGFRDPRIRFITQKNRGLAFSLNRG